MSRNYSYRREQYQRPRRRGMGCLAWLVALVWIALLSIIGYRYFLRPQVSEYIGDRIAEQVNPPVATTGPGGATDAINQQAGQVLPTVVAALPSGEVRVTEAQVNEFIATRSLGPIDSANVRFVPGEVQVELSALGVSGTAHMGLVAQNGRVKVTNPQIDGILGQFISLGDLTSGIEDQLNNQLAAQDRAITNVQVKEGVVVVEVQ